MCIRFVYRGDDIITGFNFDIDPAVWDHQIITAPDRFYLGILRPDYTGESEYYQFAKPVPVKVLKRYI